MAQIVGTAGADSLTGTAASDSLEGLAGNDTITDALGGDDFLSGGDGDDVVLDSGGGSDQLLGGEGNDVLSDLYGGASDSLSGGNGDDRLTLRTTVATNGTLDGGGGSDSILYDGGGKTSDRIIVSGGDGNDFIAVKDGLSVEAGGGAGNDTIAVTVGSQAIDYARGLFHVAGTIVKGEDGADTFQIIWNGRDDYAGIQTDATAEDKVDIGSFLSGYLVNWDGKTNPFADGHLAIAAGYNGAFSNTGENYGISIDRDGPGDAYQFQPLFTTSRNIDRSNLAGFDSNATFSPPGTALSGTDGPDTLTGGVGADTILGRSGDDRLEGGFGNDSLIGGDGNDTLLGGDGTDIAYGGDGDDLIVDGGSGGNAPSASNPSESFYGEAGNDTIQIARTTSFNYERGFVASGGVGDDVIAYSHTSSVAQYGVASGSITLDGGDGDDRITSAGDYRVVLLGGDGDDFIGTVGFSSISAGAGDDRIIATTPEPSDFTASIDLGGGRDNLDLKWTSGRSYTTPIALGADSDVDVVRITGNFRTSYFQNAVSLSQFTGGTGGDRIDLYDLIRTNVAGWDGSNPFTRGYLSLFQNGSAVTLQFRPGGSSDSSTFSITFNNTVAGAITADNIGWSPDGSPQPAGTRIEGSDTADNLIGRSGNDTISGGAGNDTLDGGFGDDTLVGGAGSDLLYGGPGRDTASYSDFTRAYSRTYSAGDGTVAGGAEGGTDRLSSIETIQFRDGSVTSSIYAPAAQVARLYFAVLQRNPDSLGLNTWVQALSGGKPLEQVAAGFTGSSEFVQKTGSLSDGDFVEYLYKSVLGRPSDPAGKQNWLDALAGGATRGHVTLGFSESLEFQYGSAGRIAGGIFVYDKDYAAVSSLYGTFADRLPDRQGLIDNVGALRSGVTLSQLADALAASGEFRQESAGLDNRGIVQLLFHNALGRDGDAGQVGAYTAQLDQGTSVGTVMLAISQSIDHQLVMDPYLRDGVVFAG